jgi:hypothetical protein
LYPHNVKNFIKMAQKNLTQLKSTRNFEHVLDSFVPYKGRLTPETIFKWDYLTCAPVMISNFGSSAHGVLADGDQFSAIFPGSDGQYYTAHASNVGAFTAVGNYFSTTLGGSATVDTNSIVGGLNFQGDDETADNLGVEMVLGGSPQGGSGNKCTIGTHSMTFDATFYSADWTDHDAVTIGFRKAGAAFETGHGAVLAAASGDPLYTDFVAFGVQSADDVQIATALNDAARTYTDTTEATAASGNHRFKITVDSAGAVTYQHVGAAAMDAGTLAAASGAPAYSFDSGDDVVPYIVVQGTNQNSGIYLKSVTVTRSPGVAWSNS